MIGKYAMAFCAFSLYGCSTPKVVLQQANHQVALMSQLEIEIQEFARLQQITATVRLESIAAQERRVESVVANASVDQAVRAALNDKSAARLQDQLRQVVESFNRKGAAESSRLDAQLAALIKPLPSTKEKSIEAQKAVAEIGRELRPGVRLQEWAEFARVISESIKANREKIDQASAAADSQKGATP